MTCYVYGITTSEHDKFIYIGASRNPKRRLNDHIASRGQRHTPLQKRLYDKHDDIGYVILSECNDWKEVLNKEKEFIELYLGAGHPLLNRFHTPLFKQEMIEIQKKKIEHFNSPEQVEKRAGMGRLMGIWFGMGDCNIPNKEVFNKCPFFREASRLFYISKEQYETVAMAFPQMGLKL